MSGPSLTSLVMKYIFVGMLVATEGTWVRLSRSAQFHQVYFLTVLCNPHYGYDIL